jgi:hypothetical protein
VPSDDHERGQRAQVIKGNEVLSGRGAHVFVA